MARISFGEATFILPFPPPRAPPCDPCAPPREAMSEALFRAARELRRADPGPGVWEALDLARAQMAHTQTVIREALSEDVVGIVFSQLCNPVDPRDAVAFGSASPWLREQEQTQALMQQLRADHETVTALCHKTQSCGKWGGKPWGRTCKELREAKVIYWTDRGLSTADLAVLGTLGAVLPALLVLHLSESAGTACGPDGVPQLLGGLGTLQAVRSFVLIGMHVGDAGASALAAALRRGALPQLRSLVLNRAAIGDAGLVALAPALRRLPALERLNLMGNPLGDEGLAALVASPPPPPAGTPPTTTGGLKKLELLHLGNTQFTDAGCAALAAARGSGVLPALQRLNLDSTHASAAAIDAVYEALAHLKE